MIDETALVNPQVKEQALLMLGTVAAVVTAGLTIRMDGETTAGQKPYKRLASYSSPVAGDRVLVAHIGGSYLVIGKVT